MSELRWADKMLIYETCVCQYFGRKYPSCAKCVEACPNDALKAGDETIEIDPQKCTQCGDCVSICPSGAISQKAEFVDTVDLSKHSEVTVVFCEEQVWAELSSEESENIKPILLEHIGVLGESDLVGVLSLTGGAVVLLALVICAFAYLLNYVVRPLGSLAAAAVEMGGGDALGLDLNL